MHLGYFKIPKSENICHSPTLSKQQEWHKFSLDRKIDMVHDVVVLNHPHNEVVKKYFRTPSYVSGLVSRVKKNRSLLSEMMAKRDEA